VDRSVRPANPQRAEDRELRYRPLYRSFGPRLAVPMTLCTMNTTTNTNTNANWNWETPNAGFRWNPGQGFKF
jgi:hypothetical protein